MAPNSSLPNQRQELPVRASCPKLHPPIERCGLIETSGAVLDDRPMNRVVELAGANVGRCLDGHSAPKTLTVLDDPWHLSAIFALAATSVTLGDLRVNPDPDVTMNQKTRSSPPENRGDCATRVHGRFPSHVHFIDEHHDCQPLHRDGDLSAD